MKTLQKVNSSQLHSLGFDAVEGVMTALFHCKCTKGGTIKSDPNCACKGTGTSGRYEYPDTAPEVYAAIRDAKSKGQSTGATFNMLIKRGGKDGKGFPFTFTPHGS